MPRSAGTKFIGVRESKENLTGLLGKKEEVVVTRHGKPIAWVVPVKKWSPEDLLLEIGMVVEGAGVSKWEALRALQAAQKTVSTGSSQPCGTRCPAKRFLSPRR